MDKYVLIVDGDWITYDQAVTEISKVVTLPGSIKSNRRNYFGQRIRDAASQRRFRRKGDGKGAMLERVPFLRWAISQWPELKEHTPPSLEIEDVEVKIEGPSLRLDVSVPDDYEELVARYVRAMNELSKSRKKLRKCRAQLAVLKKKQHSLRLKHKAAGRKGGGPKK